MTSQHHHIVLDTRYLLKITNYLKKHHYRYTTLARVDFIPKGGVASVLKVYHLLSCHREEYEHEVEHLGTSENNAISEFIHYHLVLKKPIAGINIPW